jgi:hypothetical protein
MGKDRGCRLWPGLLTRDQEGVLICINLVKVLDKFFQDSFTGGEVKAGPTLAGFGGV